MKNPAASLMVFLGLLSDPHANSNKLQENYERSRDLLEVLKPTFLKRLKNSKNPFSVQSVSRTKL
jgi:hypothetical protein